jgi:DNA-binding transcriptional LysR family regulator
MMKENLNDLAAFLTVAREGSFTRAAAQLGVSQSALSQTIRALEERLGLRLLTRTTRSVAPTVAGERLLAMIGPRLEGIEDDIATLSDLRDKPAGSIRITASEHAANSILLPKLATLLPDYPDIKFEINTDYRMVDIVEQRFDAGVRLGESIAKDMIAVRIGPDVRMAVVATPRLFLPAPAADETPGPDGARLHQRAPADPWRLAALGLQEGQPGSQRACRRHPDLQRLPANYQGRAGWTGAGLHAGRSGAGAHRRRAPGARARRLVRRVPGLPPVLPEPPPASPAFSLVVDTLRYHG